MTIDEEKKFRLYPRDYHCEDGEWPLHNSDPFFGLWEPEYFQNQSEWELKGVKRDIRGTEIDFTKCIFMGVIASKSWCWKMIGYK